MTNLPNVLGETLLRTKYASICSSSSIAFDSLCA